MRLSNGVRMTTVSIAIGRMSATRRRMHESRRRKVVYSSFSRVHGGIAMHRRKSALRWHPWMHSVVHKLPPRHMMSIRLKMAIPLPESQTNLRHDPFIPRACLDGIKVGHYLRDHKLPLLGTSVIQCRLNNIIRILVINHLDHSPRSDHLADQKLLLRLPANTNRLKSERTTKPRQTFSMTLELNLALESCTTWFWN